MDSERRRPWYRDGLRFGCTQCGNCCTGPTGRVWFSPPELKKMAQALGILPFEFVRRYTRKLDGRPSLTEVERDGEYDCVFLVRDPNSGSAGCKIYEARPAQCRTWPFWPENLKSRGAWKSAARGCPGMTVRDGEEVDLGEIERRRDATPRP